MIITRLNQVTDLMTRATAMVEPDMEQPTIRATRSLTHGHMIKAIPTAVSNTNTTLASLLATIPTTTMATLLATTTLATLLVTTLLTPRASATPGTLTAPLPPATTTTLLMTLTTAVIAVTAPVTAVTTHMHCINSKLTSP